MAKLRGKVMIGLFCGILGLSFPVFNLFSKQLSMDNHENRLLTGLPQVLHSPPQELLPNLDQFLVDNAPFRYQMVALDANLDYALFGTSQSSQVLAGKDGWLFYKDGAQAARPVANYQGLESTFDDELVLAETSAGLQRFSDALAESGCTLVLDLTPSKDRVYREYMPEGYPIVNEENRTDRFVAYMRSHTTVPVSWQYQALRERAVDNPGQPLYYKTDTHWNQAGALLGLDGVLAAAGMEVADFSAYHFVEDGTHSGDMANVAALYTMLPPDPEYKADNYSGMYEVDNRTVGVIGDSFSEAYMPYLEQRFAAAWRAHIDTLAPEMAHNPGCDLLILEVTERTLDQLIGVLTQDF